MSFEQFDISTQHKLDSMQKLFSYRSNCEKMLHMHQSNSKVRLILGGKRSGKTTFGIIETSWAGLGVHPFLNYPEPPLTIRVCSVDFISGVKGIVLPMYYAWLGPQGGPIIKKFWAEDRLLEFHNGTIIDFKSYDQDLDKFEGVGRHLIWMDEEPPKDKYQSNYMRTIAANLGMDPLGGKMMITCTPLYGMTWLYSDLYDNEEAVPPYVEHAHVSIYDNPHLNKEAIDAVLKDPAMKDNLDAAIEGKFIAKSGLIYGQFSEDHIIKPVHPIPDDWLIVLGIDPHDRNPHGVLFCALTKENVWVIFDEILEQCVLNELVARIKIKLGKRWPPNLAIIDTSGNAPQSITGTSVNDVLKQKYGLYVMDAHKDIQSGRLKVSQLLDPGPGLKPKLYVTENCRQLIREFRHYCYDQSTEILTDKGWKLFKDLNKSEYVATLNPNTWTLEYQRPYNYIDDKYSGRMLLGEHKTTNFCVTPDHKFYGAGRYNYSSPKAFKIAPIDSFPKAFMVKRDAHWIGEEISKFSISGFDVPIQDWLKFMGLFLSEGYAHSSQNQVVISQLKDSRYFEEIKYSLSKLPFRFKYDGYKFYCYNHILHDYLYPLGNSHTKYIPEQLKKMSSSLLEHLMRGLMIGDGTIIAEDSKNNNKYKSVSRKLIDDVQEIALKLDSYGNVYRYKDTFDFIFSRNNGFSKIQGFEEIDYEGRVYCVSVPNHIIYVRRNGKAMWCGNCWDNWARYKDKMNPKERPLKKDDHLLDALRYVVMSQICYRHPKLAYQKIPPDHISRTTGYF